jgi:hypothetical protein
MADHVDISCLELSSFFLFFSMNLSVERMRRSCLAIDLADCINALIDFIDEYCGLKRIFSVANDGVIG